MLKHRQGCFATADNSLLMPDHQAYLRAIAQAAHDVGALFVLDCVASGCLWVDTNLCDYFEGYWCRCPHHGRTHVDRISEGMDINTMCRRRDDVGVIAGPLTACKRQMQINSSDSFVLDLKKWHQIMAAERYLNGGHAYHARTMTVSCHASDRRAGTVL